MDSAHAAGLDLNAFISRRSQHEMGVWMVGPLIISASSDGTLDVVERLLALGADVNAMGFYNDVDRLLEIGRAPKLTTSPLTEACFGGYFDIVKCLLKAGADTCQTCSDGFSPLMQAAWANSPRYAPAEWCPFDGSTVMPGFTNIETYTDIAALLVAKSARFHVPDTAVASHGWDGVGTAGEEGGYLVFPEGARIELLEECEAVGWWKGRLNGKVGYFPSTYTKVERWAEVRDGVHVSGFPGNVLVTIRYLTREVPGDLRSLASREVTGRVQLYDASERAHLDFFELLCTGVPLAFNLSRFGDYPPEFRERYRAVARILQHPRAPGPFRQLPATLVLLVLEATFADDARLTVWPMVRERAWVAMRAI